MTHPLSEADEKYKHQQQQQEHQQENAQEGNVWEEAQQDPRSSPSPPSSRQYFSPSSSRNVALTAPSPFVSSFNVPGQYPQSSSGGPYSPSYRADFKAHKKTIKAQAKASKDEARTLVKDLKYEVKHQAKELKRELKHQTSEALRTVKSNLKDYEDNLAGHSSSGGDCCGCPTSSGGTCAGSSSYGPNPYSTSPRTVPPRLPTQGDSRQQRKQEQKENRRERKQERKDRKVLRDLHRQEHHHQHCYDDMPLTVRLLRINSKMITRVVENGLRLLGADTQPRHHGQLEPATAAVAGSQTILVAPAPLTPTVQTYQPPAHAPPPLSSDQSPKKSIGAQEPLMVYSMSGLSLNNLGTELPTPSAPPAPLAASSSSSSSSFSPTAPVLMETPGFDLESSAPPPSYEAAIARRS